MPRRTVPPVALSPAGRELAQRFDALFARMEEARGALARGEVPDLLPVRELLDGILERFSALPQEEVPAFEPRMLALVAEVRELGRVLGEALDAVGSELAGMAERVRAARAYGRGGGGGEG